MEKAALQLELFFVKSNSEKAGLPICVNISLRCGSEMPLRASGLRLTLGSDTQGSYKTVSRAKMLV